MSRMQHTFSLFQVDGRGIIQPQVSTVPAHQQMSRYVAHEMFGTAVHGRVLVQIRCIHPKLGNLVQQFHLRGDVIDDGTTVRGATRDVRHGPASPSFPVRLCLRDGDERFQERDQV